MTAPVTIAGDGVGGAGAINNVAGNVSLTGALNVAGATVTNSAAGTTLTIAGPVNLLAPSSITFAGAGNITVNQPFGNGSAPGLFAGIEEKLFDAEVVGGGNPQSNIEGYRTAALGSNDAQGVLVSRLHYNDDAAFDTRAAALGASGFDPNNGPTSGNDYSALWVTSFTPNESGAWGFRFSGVDDNASMWIDTTGTVGVFDATGDRFYNRGCCGGSGDRLTPALTANQTYLLGFLMNDTGGGGYFRDMEFKAPSGSWTELDPAANPSLFRTLQTPNNAVIKTGTGTLTFLGANTYNGPTTVTGGTLVAANSAALGTTDAGTTVGTGATLALQGGIAIPAGEALTLGGGGDVGPGTLLNLGGTNTYGGNVTLSGSGAAAVFNSQAGTLIVGGTVTMGNSSLTVTGAGNTVIEGAISGTNTAPGVATPGLLSGYLSGNMSFAANPGNDGVKLSPHAGLTNASPPWADNRTWVYTGWFYDADGTFSFGENIDDVAWMMIDGVVRLNNSSWNTPTGTGVLNLGAGPYGDGWHMVEIRFSNGGGGAGAVSGNGWTATKGFGLNVNGTTSTNGASYLDSVTDPGDATLWRLATPAARSDLIKTGSGTLTLNGASTYVGTTTVLDGRLRVNGSITSNTTVQGGWLDGTGTIFGNVDVQSAGSISAGNSPGHLHITGNYTQSGTMLAELGGTSQGVNYDWIEVDGTGTLGGTVDVNFFGGFYPAVGDHFDVLTAAGGITNPDLSGVLFDFADAQLTVAATYWKTEIFPLGGGAEALRLSIGVPEPSSAVLAALGLLGLGIAGWRRWRSR